MKEIPARMDTHLVFFIDDLGPLPVKALRKEFTKANSKFFQLKRMGRRPWGVPSKIESWRMEGDKFLILPRGATKRINEVLADYDMKIGKINDKTLSCKPAGFSIREGESLRPDQIPIVDFLVKEKTAIVRGGCGCGKALAHGEMVILFDKTVPIEEVNVGDLAANPDGNFYLVNGVFPQGDRELFRVRFTDGSYTDCDGEHLWTLVKRRKGTRSKGWPSIDISTKDLMRKRLRNKAGRCFFLPEVQPLCWPSRWPNQRLPLDPYFLGALLGDGHLSIKGRVLFTTADTEILSHIKLPPRRRFKALRHSNSGKAKTYIISSKPSNMHKIRPLWMILESLGLMGKTSHTKFVPDLYKRTSVENRLALIQGLFDTDATPRTSGAVEYSTVSLTLAEDVRDMVRSLGGTCSIKSRITKCKNIKFPSFRLEAKLPKDMAPFRLNRKQARIAKVKRQREPYRAVDSIEKLGFGKATCLSVESPDHLFLTGQFVPTHNTVILLGAIAKINQPAIVIVHTNALRDQWHDAVIRWLGIEPGVLGDGKKRIAPITIATQKTIWNMSKSKDLSWTQKFGVLVADESHRWSSETFNEVARIFPATYRLAASADERRKDQKEFLLYENFGTAIYKIEKSALIESGDILPVRMEVVPTNYRDEIYLATIRSGMFCSSCGGVLTSNRHEKLAGTKRCTDCDLMAKVEPLDWVGMLNRMVQDTQRNELIFKHLKRVLLQEPKARILMLNERVKACRQWAARLILQDISAGLLLGGPDNKKELKRAISGLKSGKVTIGVGTTVADEGLDIPPLTYVVMTCPIHTHPKRLKQMVGRSARPHKKKVEGKALYFWDKEMFPALVEEVGLTAHGFKCKSFLKRLSKTVDDFTVYE